MILFADYNTPYLFAISFVLLIGLLEIIAIVCGHMLSGALDAHLDHYDSITTGNISQALHYLNIGRLPALVILCLLAGFFWPYRHRSTACLRDGLESSTLKPVGGSCLFTAHCYYSALYRQGDRPLDSSRS